MDPPRSAGDGWEEIADGDAADAADVCRRSWFEFLFLFNCTHSEMRKPLVYKRSIIALSLSGYLLWHGCNKSWFISNSERACGNFSVVFLQITQFFGFSFSRFSW